ncbi:ETX/MTX2 family pore-forming toxin [Trichocoleus desertorum AS-A10]|uniref:jacalin-like lectin n=1 Tax=Trichocoleus desertorum TaxID=1481672 RepID=UPI0032976F04
MSNVYVAMRAIGGSGGNPFGFYGGTNGTLLQKIGVWAEGWMVKAVRVWLTDGTMQTFGNPSGSYKEHSFQPGERMTRLSLWGNGKGSRLGWIEFATDKGITFSHGMTDWKRNQEYPIDIGSGICCGVFGRAGSDIDNMGFVFLQKIRSSRLTDVTYPTLGLQMAVIQPRVIDSEEFHNSTSREQTQTFSVEEKITRKSSWSITAGLEYSYTSKVEAGIPEVATVGAESTWKVSISGTYGKEETEESTKRYDFPVVCPPNSRVKATATIKEGKLSVPYKGVIEVVLEAGSSFRYPIEGIYEGVSCSEVYFDIEEIGAAGYELFWNGQRVGHEPTWTRQQAIENLEWNKTQRPDVLVEGWYNGEKMGYELFLDTVRVKFEPTWTRQQAIADLRWQRLQNQGKNYKGWFNGEDLNTLAAKAEATPVTV